MDIEISKSEPLKNFIKGFLSKESLDQFKRYLVVGFSTFFIEYGIFFLMYKVIRIWYIESNTAAYIISFCFNYLMSRFWSFKSTTTNIKKQLISYTFLFLFNMVATNLLMYLLSDIVGINPLISKVLIMGAVVSWNFVLYRKVIFK